MKKIGIMTLFDNNNFGAALQAYALQYVLRRNEYECEDISYLRLLPNTDSVLRVKRIAITIKNSIVHPIHMFGIKKKKRLFKKFIDQHILYSERKYTKKDIGKSTQFYDCFICGSDNIWNKNLLDTSFVLDFVPDSIKKIAYAPGMSTTELSSEQKQIMLPLIERIDYLSCREKIGCDLIERNINRSVFHAMDPTLLVESEVWETLSERSEINLEGEYIFALIYGNSFEKCEFVNSIGLRLKKELVTIPFGTGIYNRNDLRIGATRIIEAGPIEILSLIKDAQFVVTDTFHATIFSILFHKNFVSLRRFKNTKSEKLDHRIDGLLEKLGIGKEHIVEDLTDIDDAVRVYNKGIDYSLVDSRLIEWRKNSFDYLKNALTE